VSLRRLLPAIGVLIIVLVTSVTVTLSVDGGRSTDAAPTPASTARPQAPSAGKLTLISALAGPQRSKQVASRVAGLRVMNYYPAADGWTYMWTNWSPGTLRADFARIRALGANTVRIIVFPDTFGWPRISGYMAARFAAALHIAASEGLGVQLTLFDLWNDYAEVGQSQAWLKELLDPYASDPEIQLIELKNEVDPSVPVEVTWLRALLPTLRSVMPHTPSTVSVSGTAGPAGFALLRRELNGSPLDVADIHLYGSDTDAYGWMLAAKRAAGPLPLFIGEAGYPVTVSSYGGLEAGELQQAQWYSVVFAAARAAGVPPPAPWTLYDFKPGAIPALVHDQVNVPEAYHFGLYSATGQWRPSVWVVEQAFAGRNVDFSDFTSGLSGMSSLLVWTPYVSQLGELAYDPNVGYLRPGSIRLSDTPRGKGKASAFFLVPTDPAIPGQLWTVSVWATGINVNGVAQLSLAWFDPAGAYLGETNSGPLPSGNPPWTQLVVRAQVPPGAAAIQLFLKSSGVAGTVWFDNVQITVSP
jgi:Cellulase (glycosyl hydrolase family 5)